jgi:mono/diheme cytochrome c family protein
LIKRSANVIIFTSMMNVNKTCWPARLAVMIILAMVLSGCQALADRGAESTPQAPLDPAEADMLSQGLVELVPDGLPAPVLPSSPTQADYGAEPYYQICMACHGNWGQGLTDEWRATGFGGDDENCWQSKCHASNHPPQGFVLPESIPPLLGWGSMTRISTADELYNVIFTSMPWWNPGSLSSEDAWAITAYLLRARGEIPDGITLTAGNATIYRLHAPAPSVVDERPGVIGLALSFLVAMILLIFKKAKTL